MENLYKNIYSVIDQGVALNRILWDQNGDAVDYITEEANQSYADMLKIPLEDIIGRTILEIMPGFKRSWIKAIGTMVKDSELKRYEKYNVELDKFFEITLLPRENDQFILVSTDVTQHRHKERQMCSLVEELTASEEEIRSNYLELEKAKNRLEEENNRRLQYITSINQELEMPLNGILDFSKLLAQTEIDEKQQKYLGMIEESCVRMMGLINTLKEKTVGRLDAPGMLIPVSRRFKVRDCLLRVATEFIVICENRNLKFSFNMDNHIPFTVIGDELILTQVMTEILENFIKNTKEGEISLKAYKVFQMDKKITVKFELRDTGINLQKDSPAALAERITNPSVQELIKLVNGQLWFEEGGSNEEGTVYFTAEFFADTSKLPEIAEIDNREESAEFTGKTILVAEENSINMKIITEQLKRCGYSILCAQSGMEAVHQFIRHKVDLILLDIHLGDQDGYETTAMIRRMELALGTHVPIIGTMSTALPGTGELCINAGMEDYILKPFDTEKLYRTIKSYI